MATAGHSSRILRPGEVAFWEIRMDITERWLLCSAPIQITNTETAFGRPPSGGLSFCAGDYRLPRNAIIPIRKVLVGDPRITLQNIGLSPAIGHQANNKVD